MDAYTATKDAIVSGTSAKTILQLLTPSTVRGLLTGWAISFDGVTGGAVPGLVEILRQTSAGTMTALTPNPVDSAAPASLITASHTATVEPSGGTVIYSKRISPNGGVIDVPLYGDDRIRIPISSFLGLRVTFAATVNCTPELHFLA